MRIAAWAAEPALAERAAAEAYAAGASGLEEIEAPGEAEGSERGTRLLLYAPSARAEAVRRALEPLAGPGLAVEAPEPVEPEDWAESWRSGLGPVAVSPRLVVRPSFAEAEASPGREELVIDPGQAFGTGGHASTRLALVLLDALPRGALAGARVLDAGAGTGVLAIAACRLGAERAVAFDVDWLAAAATARNAAQNGVAARVAAFAGGADALAPGARFDLLLANLLRTELLPILPALANALRPGGVALFSGLLVAEAEEVSARLEAAGLRVEARREERDGTGDAWLGLLTRRRSLGASPRGGDRARPPAASAEPSR